MATFEELTDVIVTNDTTKLARDTTPLDRERAEEVYSFPETPIVVQWSTEGDTFSTPGKLQDLSRSGIRLLVETPIALKNTIELSIKASELGFATTISAQVRGVRAQVDKQWLLDCSFLTEFPEAALNDLAAHGFLNRRRDPRIPIAITAFVRRELTDDAVNVRLEDYSCGGFRMFSPIEMKVGERVLVLARAAGGECCSIAARIMWQIEVDNGYRAGSCFLNSDGYSQMVRVVQEQTPTPTGSSLQVEEKVSWKQYLSYFFGLTRASID